MPRPPLAWLPEAAMLRTTRMLVGMVATCHAAEFPRTPQWRATIRMLVWRAIQCVSVHWKSHVDIGPIHAHPKS